ncbi:hypothetical protein BDN70DRAFT_882972 [Pholiota conissans]|uniref:Uncharacterized protein n=1 Tax=Pholiota conissans TaxID=109636 RepID=A0A9P5YWJ3_9AGAR|nr:hypothetical protein BDN70DRAFT_882972 [Pholiota conissans]
MADALSQFEHSIYIGSYMSGILYGINLVMYFLTLQGLLRKTNHNSPKSRRFFAIYSTILLLLITIDVAVNAVWGELMWIEGRNGPGGVPGFIATQTAAWYQTMGSTAVVIMIFMGDALLLYRLFVIYGSKYIVIAFPVLAYLAGLSLAIIELVIAGKPGGNFFHGKSINFGTPYYTITISLNIIITLLIVSRLLKLGKAVSRALGRDSAKMYTSVAAMLVESAAPYSAVGVMFLIPYAMGNPIAISFGQVWAKIACLAPQLIVLRVVTGRAWGREVITQAQSNVEFLSNGRPVVHASGIELQSHGTTTLGDAATEKWNSSTKSLGSS